MMFEVGDISFSHKTFLVYFNEHVQVYDRKILILDGEAGVSYEHRASFYSKFPDSTNHTPNGY